MNDAQSSNQEAQIYIYIYYIYIGIYIYNPKHLFYIVWVLFIIIFFLTNIKTSLRIKKTSLRAEILVFRIYSQAAQACTDLRILEYDLGKVYGKNYLDDDSLLNKQCGLKKKAPKTVFLFTSRNFGFSNI